MEIIHLVMFVLFVVWALSGFNLYGWFSFSASRPVARLLPRGKKSTKAIVLAALLLSPLVWLGLLSVKVAEFAKAKVAAFWQSLGIES